MKVGGRLHFVLFHKFICGNSWKKGVRHQKFYSELVLWGVGHRCFYFILAGLLPPLVAPHGDLELTDTNRLSVIVAVVWHGPSIPGDLKNPSENASKTHWSIGLSLRRYSSIFSAVNSGILVVPSKFGRLKSRVCQVIRNFPNAESLVWSNPEDHWGDSGHNRR